MRYFAANTPGFWLLAGVEFAVLDAQVVSLAIAMRQRRRVNAARNAANASTRDRPLTLPSGWPCVVLSSTWLLIPAVAAYVVNGVRAMDITTSRSTNLPWRITDQPNVFSCAVAFAVPSATIAAIAVTMTLALRGHPRKRAALPLAFLVAAVFPLAAGIWSYSRSIAHALGSFANDYPETLGSSLSPGMAHARLLLEFWAQLACAGLAIVAVLWAVLVTASRQQEPHALANGRSCLRDGVVSALCLGVSIAIFSLGGPLRAENRSPWPPPAHNTFSSWRIRDLPPIPVLTGPDTLVSAPELQMRLKSEGEDAPDDVVVQVTSSSPMGTAEDPRETFRLARLNDSLLHPASAHDILNVACAPEVQSAQLGRFLRIAMEVGYRSCSFACAHTEEIHRPIFGLLTRLHVTGINVSLASAAGQDAVGERSAKVSLRDYPTFGDIAHRMAELRLAGKQVILDLSP